MIAPPDAACRRPTRTGAQQLIFERYQGNRNPFIDHPEWVAAVADF